MPTYSFKNPNGDPELALRQRQAAMSDWVAQQNLSNQLAIAKLNADTQRYSTDRNFESNGSFVDRAKNNLDVQRLGNEGQANVASIGVAPQMGRLGLEQQEYQDKAPLRGLANAKANLEMQRLAPQGRIAGLIDSQVEQALGGAGGQPAPAGPGVQPQKSILGANDIRSLVRGYAGLGADPNEELRLAVIKDRLANDPEHSNELLAAANDPTTPLPTAPATFNARKAEEMTKAEQAITPEITSLQQALAQHKGHYMMTPGERAQIKSLYDLAVNKLNALRVSPENQQLILKKIQQNIDQQLRDNAAGGFELFGSDALRGDLGIAH